MKSYCWVAYSQSRVWMCNWLQSMQLLRKPQRLCPRLASFSYWCPKGHGFSSLLYFALHITIFIWTDLNNLALQQTWHQTASLQLNSIFHGNLTQCCYDGVATGIPIETECMHLFCRYSPYLTVFCVIVFQHVSCKAQKFTLPVFAWCILQKCIWSSQWQLVTLGSPRNTQKTGLWSSKTKTTYHHWPFMNPKGTIMNFLLLSMEQHILWVHLI